MCEAKWLLLNKYEKPELESNKQNEKIAAAV